jgi:hypothetical protein
MICRNDSSGRRNEKCLEGNSAGCRRDLRLFLSQRRFAKSDAVRRHLAPKFCRVTIRCGWEDFQAGAVQVSGARRLDFTFTAQQFPSFRSRNQTRDVEKTGSRFFATCTQSRKTISSWPLGSCYNQHCNLKLGTQGDAFKTRETQEGAEDTQFEKDSCEHVSLNLRCSNLKIWTALSLDPYSKIFAKRRSSKSQIRDA